MSTEENVFFLVIPASSWRESSAFCFSWLAKEENAKALDSRLRGNDEQRAAGL
jgi:hypothetical protein